MAQKFNINSFLKLSPEKQAQEIEKQTQKLVERLPSLRKWLKMYNDNSSEMYNLKEDEVKLQGTIYARAVRGGSITTPSSKKAYSNFIKNLQKYTRTSISQLAYETARQRMESWLSNIESASTPEDIAYARELYNSMTEEEKLGFTRSQFFMDSSYMYMVTEEDGKQYSIQTLKLELYLEENRGHTTRHIYRTKVKGNEGKLRRYRRKKK